MNGGGHPEELLGALSQPLAPGDQSLAGPPQGPEEYQARVSGWKQFLTAMQHDPYVRGTITNLGIGMTQPRATTAAMIGGGLQQAQNFQAGLTEQQRAAMQQQYERSIAEKKLGLEERRVGAEERDVAARIGGRGYYAKDPRAGGTAQERLIATIAQELNIPITEALGVYNSAGLESQKLQLDLMKLQLEMADFLGGDQDSVVELIKALNDPTRPEESKESLYERARRLIHQGTGQAAERGYAGRSGAPSRAPVPVTSGEDARSLPEGTRVVGPDGQKGVVVLREDGTKGIALE